MRSCMYACMYAWYNINICMHGIISIYVRAERVPTLLGPCASSLRRGGLTIVGWSNNHFNDLHFILPLETNKTTTCAAERSLINCVCLKRRLIK